MKVLLFILLFVFIYSFDCFSQQKPKPKKNKKHYSIDTIYRSTAWRIMDSLKVKGYLIKN